MQIAGDEQRISHRKTAFHQAKAKYYKDVPFLPPAKILKTIIIIRTYAELAENQPQIYTYCHRCSGLAAIIRDNMCKSVAKFCFLREP